jgi:hypothetical protein
MKWDEIRTRYPQQWLLIEAIQARTEEGKRILDQISVINSFPDSPSALQAYKKLHHDEPQRELFVVHTDRVDLDINVRRWLGIRGLIGYRVTSCP